MDYLQDFSQHYLPRVLQDSGIPTHFSWVLEFSSGILPVLFLESHVRFLFPKNIFIEFQPAFISRFLRIPLRIYRNAAMFLSGFLLKIFRDSFRVPLETSLGHLTAIPPRVATWVIPGILPGSPPFNLTHVIFHTGVPLGIIFQSFSGNFRELSSTVFPGFLQKFQQRYFPKVLVGFLLKCHQRLL